MADAARLQKDKDKEKAEKPSKKSRLAGFIKPLVQHARNDQYTSVVEQDRPKGQSSPSQRKNSTSVTPPLQRVPTQGPRNATVDPREESRIRMDNALNSIDPNAQNGNGMNPLP